MGSLGITELLVIAVIVIVLFGTKRLRNMGSDLGSAIKGFKQAMKQEDTAQLDNPPANPPPSGQVQNLDNQKDKSSS